MTPSPADALTFRVIKRLTGLPPTTDVGPLNPIIIGGLIVRVTGGAEGVGVMVATCEELTPTVWIEARMYVWPAGMVTDEVVIAVEVEASCTTKPPAGAGLLRLTVNSAGNPPETVVGERLNVVMEAACTVILPEMPPKLGTVKDAGVSTGTIDVFTRTVV
jgi:hypothetical protein